MTISTSLLDADLAARWAAPLADALRARGWRLAAAESCTGGLIAATCTALAGSSDWFERGFVTYSNEAKCQQLGVDAALLAAHGAVSEAVACAMAKGARERLHGDIAVAVTGIAGPGGGSPEKPVGTVWIAVADETTVGARHVLFAGSREEIRGRAAQMALYLMHRRFAATTPAVP
jgi:nicotinamide-nucleotide amidase